MVLEQDNHVLLVSDIAIFVLKRDVKLQLTNSCLANTLMFLDNISTWIPQGQTANVVFLDFAKAFDKVPHQRLLLKLANHGIGEKVLEWISN